MNLTRRFGVARIVGAATVFGALVASCGGDIRLTSPDAGAPVAATCQSDSACARGRCDVSSGACVECVLDAHCTTSGLDRCDPSLHRCVECRVTADCAPGMTCEAGSRRCLPSCLPPSTCPSTAPTCDAQRGVCLPCTVSSSCVDGRRRVCDVAGGRCVECLVDAECGGDERRVCDPVNGRCVGCRTSADCATDREHPICDVREGECAEREGS